ncbi:MAG TPA: hypothetical protein DDW50_21365 [Firmicutes bacterium]|nr:hypothetical protein [Bacillota bacterium]
MFAFKNQRGATLELALFILVFAIVLATAVLPAVRQELNFSPMDTKRVSAEYLAQEGVQSCIKTIGDNLRSLNGKGSQGLGTLPTLSDYITTLTNTVGTWNLVTSYGSTTVGGYGKYRVIYYPSLDASGNPSKMNITSIGMVGNYTETITANVQVITKPVGGSGVVDLINNNNFVDKDNTYTYGGKWVVSQTNGVSYANPSSTGFSQILFKNNPGGLGTASGTQLTYFANLGTATTASATGYGIYYGCDPDTTATNPTSYVFQYDPGAQLNGDGGGFFVKKVDAASDRTPSDVYGNETRDYRYGFEDNEGTSGDATNNGTVRISLNDLATKMKNYYSSTSSDLLPSYLTKKADGSLADFSILNQTHSITIDVEAVYNGDGTINYYHQIVSCDGYPILDFVDHDTKYPILKNNSFANTCTGLRTWNAKSFNFYNNTGYLQVNLDTTTITATKKTIK